MIRDVAGPDWIKVEKVRDGDGYQLEFSGRPPAKPGRVTGTVRVTTDHPRYSMIEVPFEGLVRGAATVTPASLVQIRTTGGWRPVTVRVRGRNGTAVTGVEAVIRKTVPGETAPRPGTKVPDVTAAAGGGWIFPLPDPLRDGPRVTRKIVEVAVNTAGGTETPMLPLLILRPSEDAR